MFKHLSLRMTSLLLLLLLLFAGGVTVVGGLYINNSTGYIKTSWQTFDTERSEITRLESHLRAALGYGGMIHDFKNYILRKEPKLKAKAIGHLNQARAIIDQYNNLNLSNAERAAIEDIAATLRHYEKAISKIEFMAGTKKSSKEIDIEVKIDDKLAFRGLEMLHEESVIRVTRNGSPASKALLLGELRGVLGYGGMIHHYKNFVLRGEEKYSQASLSKIEASRDILNRYRKLQPTPGERSALDKIAHMLGAYAEGLKTKTTLVASRMSAEETDKIVKVDDSHALQALSILDSEISASIDVRSLNMTATIGQMEFVSSAMLWGVLFVLGSVAMITFVIIRVQFISPLQSLSQSMSELCTGNIGVEIAHTEDRNEIGDIARAVQTFRENLIRVKEVEEQLTQSNEEMNAQLVSTQDMKERSDEQAAKAIDLVEGLAIAKEEAERATFRAEADESRVRSIMNTVVDAIITISEKGLIETFNPAAQSMFGYTEDEVIGLNVNILMPEPHRSQHDGYLSAYSTGTGVGRMGKRVDLTATRADETIFPIEATVRMTRIGGAVKFIGVLRDITEQKKAQDEIRRLAMTDQLTGLANRNQFHHRFTEALKLARREDKRLSLLLLDLDKFKPVNDTFGHPVGDALLQSVSSTFTKLSRETDIVARLGGDEFAILMVHPDDIKVAGISAQKIVDEILKPFDIMGHEIQIGTSVGIAIFPEDADSEEGLIQKADLALYEAKESGRNCFRYYKPSMDQDEK